MLLTLYSYMSRKHINDYTYFLDKTMSKHILILLMSIRCCENFKIFGN